MSRVSPTQSAVLAYLQGCDGATLQQIVTGTGIEPRLASVALAKLRRRKLVGRFLERAPRRAIWSAAAGVPQACPRPADEQRQWTEVSARQWRRLVYVRGVPVTQEIHHRRGEYVLRTVEPALAAATSEHISLQPAKTRAYRVCAAMKAPCG